MASALAVMTPLVVLHGYTLYHQNELAEAEAFASVSAHATARAKTVQAMLQRTTNLLEVLAARADLATLDPQQCSDLLSGMATLDPLYANLMLIAADGRLVCAAVAPARGDPAVEFGGQAWFTAAMLTDGPSLSAPVPSPVAKVR